MDDYQLRLAAMVEEMNGESERAVAIVGAAWVEEGLTNALREITEDHAEAKKRLFAGALSTFSAKIDLAKVLGLVSDAIWKDLHAIRVIRNAFAHDVAHKTEHTRLSFKNQSIHDKCIALRCVSSEKIEDARHAYTRACAVLNNDFEFHVLMGAKLSGIGRVIAKDVDAG